MDVEEPPRGLLKRQAGVVSRRQLRGRRLLLEVLTDLDAGALSALERRYLRDGALGHSSTADRWTSPEPDLAPPAAGRVTLRAGWRQVLEPCRLATTVAAVLQTRGWTGDPQPCPRCRATTAVA